MFEVRVLGDVAVAADGGAPVRLRRRELELVAMLASRVGRLVPADVLIEAVWGDELPQNPTGALHTAMSRLRTAIGDGGDRVATEGSAYRLDLDSAQVDAGRFEALVGAAADAPDGDTSRLLTEALDLWRGTAFAGFEDNTFLRSEIVRLGELRVVALEARIRADLALGRQRDLVVELTHLTQEHPYNEALWGLLMESLYGLGRQNEALRAYQQARRRLASDLGLEPGPALRRLEESILLHDRGLRTEPVAASGSLGWMRLPSPWTSFVGRDAEVKQLADIVRSSRLVTVTGIGGIGKSRLANRVAHDLTLEFVDGTGSIRFDKGDAGRAASTVIARALGVDAAGTVAIDRLVDLLRGREVLLVVDGAEGAVGTAGVIRSVLEECPAVSILATSRVALGMAGETVFPLGSLSAPADDDWSGDAVQLFIDRATARDPGIAMDQASGPTVARIVRQLGGVPLAIELAALRAGVSLDSLAAEFEERLDGLVTTDATVPERHRSLVAALDGTFDSLSPGARKLLNAISFFSVAWTIDDAVAVSGEGTSEAEARAQLGELIAASLVASVTEGGQTSYSLLSVVRTRCRASLDPAESSELAARHADAIDRLCGSKVYEFGPVDGVDEVVWVRRLEARLADLVAAIDWMIEEQPTRAASLVARLRWFWVRADLWAVAEGIVRRVLAATDGLTEDRAWMHVTLGAVVVAGGDLNWSNTAFSVPSLRIRERQRRHPDEASRSAESFAINQRALDMFRELGHDEGIGYAHMGRIAAYGLADRLEDAARAFNEAIEEIHTRKPAGSDLLRRMISFYSVGLDLAEGNVERARMNAQREVDGLTPDTNPWLAITFLDRRARVARAEADQRGAIELYRRAIVEYAAPNAFVIEALLYAEIGIRYSYLMDYGEAMRNFGLALRLGRSYGLPRIEPWVRIGQATIAGVTGRAEDAEGFLDSALRTYTRLNDQEGQAIAFMLRAVLAEHAGDLETAAENSRIALRLGSIDPAAVGHPLRIIARSLAAAGEIHSSARLWGASVGIRRRAAMTTPPWQPEDFFDRELRDRLGDEFEGEFSKGFGWTMAEATEAATSV